MARRTEAGVGVLTEGELSRATLAPQMLLGREPRPALEVVEHLVGMQAQNPLDPYHGLWNRIEGFRLGALAELLQERDVVRATLMRGTIHLVTGADCGLLRPFVQPVVERTYGSGAAFGGRLKQVTTGQVRAACIEFLQQEPRTRGELRALLAERWPDEEAEAMSFMLYLIPLVQATPRGVWGQTGKARWALTEQWLAGRQESKSTIDDVVMRYLAAYGPASVADARTWSGFKALREVFDRLRPNLITFRDGKGSELFDLPNAPRPDPQTPAPARFFPEFDNVFLAHGDRARITPEAFGRRMSAAWNARGRGGTPESGPQPISWAMFSVDGYLSGTWRLHKDREGATLLVQPLVEISDGQWRELVVEGTALLGLLAQAVDPADRRVVLTGG